MAKINMVDGIIEMVIREEMVIEIKAMKLAKATGPSEVRTEMIFANGKVEISVMDGTLRTCVGCKKNAG